MQIHQIGCIIHIINSLSLCIPIISEGWLIEVWVCVTRITHITLIRYVTPPLGKKWAPFFARKLSWFSVLRCMDALFCTGSWLQWLPREDEKALSKVTTRSTSLCTAAVHVRLKHEWQLWLRPKSLKNMFRYAHALQIWQYDWDCGTKVRTLLVLDCQGGHCQSTLGRVGVCLGFPTFINTSAEPSINATLI